MNQTSWIAAGIFIGFVVYITIKGELSAYKDAILGTNAKASATPQASDLLPGLLVGLEGMLWMPILLIGSGLALVLVGLHGDPGTLYELIANDFTGQNSFVYWMLAILVIGAIGYISGLEKLSRAFLVLVIVVLFLDNGGFWSHFQEFLQQTTQPTAAQPTAKQG